MLVVYLLLALFLLLLNVFFVLVEFAAVKLRGSRIAAMVAEEQKGSELVKHIHDHLDQYLSLCQVGITFASVGLGFVGEPVASEILAPLIAKVGLPVAVAHGISITAGIVAVSAIHIVLGEQVPKMVAIAKPEGVALLLARPARFFRVLFYVPLLLLNWTTKAVLKPFGLGNISEHEKHSEDELRIILDNSQAEGVLSFRRLLFLENVFDLGELRVKDTMRPRAQVRCLHAQLHWNDNLQTIRAWRFTRYPLIDEDPDRPIGLVHLKDVLLQGGEAPTPDLKKLARPLLTTGEGTMLESLLAEMQRRRIHAALVTNAEGRWTGLVTMEDIIEEIIGTIRDEFEDEEPIHLADTITAERIQLGVTGSGPIAAVRAALARMSPGSLPLPADQIVRAIDERERIAGTYLGRNLGMPHARLTGLSKPFVMILRSEEGIPYAGTTEKAHLLFVLLTPAGQPRIHQRLQAIIATLLDESEYVQEHLRNAESPAEVLEVIRTGEQASLD
jgi:CBS domain containing-hemolysin-like protein/mannitol/fructose-specific phosphotransferase system IIA component (Ntr-type)